MSSLQIKLPPKLIPVFVGEAMYRGAYGGRGSGKSRSFAKMAAIKGAMWALEGKTGVIVCGREFMNTLAESSLAEVKAAILEEPWLRGQYDMGDSYVRTKNRAIEFAFTGLRRNLDSIKSKAKILLLWVDEAEPVSETAWSKAIPTVREEGAEIWVTWNPERKKSATHKRFREDPPPNSKIIQLNWRDNPWFTSTLQATRREDRIKRPKQYDHVWEGDFVTARDGAYFVENLMLAREEHRVCRVPIEPLMTYWAFWDIGGTGARADACSIWVAQFVGREIRLIDYYEKVGQPLSAHVLWMMEHGYTKDRTNIYLPHDGVQHDKVYQVTYESELKAAGYNVTVVPNQGAGAATLRIEALRKVFPSIIIDENRCESGLEALGWYHEKWDDKREIGLGPDHDWSSHCADAAGLMAVVSEDIFLRQRKRTQAAPPSHWMS